MTLTVKHRFVSLKADGTDATVVKPSDWNDTHDIDTTILTGMVLGARSGSSNIEELPLIYDGTTSWRFNASGTLLVPRGTTAERPPAPTEGAMRWNLDLKAMEMWNGSAWVSIAVGQAAFTGALAWSFLDSEPTGWIFFLGTVGPTGSSANHARDDARNLYDLMWVMPPSVFPMGDAGARGSSAASDWTAARPISLPDWRERIFAMSGNMWGTVPPNLIGLGSTGGFAGQATYLTTGGEKAHQLTVAEIAKHKHTFTGENIAPINSVNGTAIGNQVGGPNAAFTTNQTDETGSDVAHNNVQPTVMLNVFVKL